MEYVGGRLAAHPTVLGKATAAIDHANATVGKDPAQATIRQAMHGGDIVLHAAPHVAAIVAVVVLPLDEAPRRCHQLAWAMWDVTTERAVRDLAEMVPRAMHCFEAPVGITLRQLIEDYGGGMLHEDRPLKGVIPGGSSTPVLRPDGMETPLRDIRPGDEGALRRPGSRSGSSPPALRLSRGPARACGVGGGRGEDAPRTSVPGRGPPCSPTRQAEEPWRRAPPSGGSPPGRRRGPTPWGRKPTPGPCGPAPRTGKG